MVLIVGQVLKTPERLDEKSSAIARFEKAADAIIKGDIRNAETTLARRSATGPRKRSTREHGATLLHYVSANGVEGYRQKTPAKSSRSQELLLKAGAEVDAEADVYGGGSTTLGLVATSVHPFRAGVQNPLTANAARPRGEDRSQDGAGNRQSSVLGALANGRGEAATYLAERGARLNLEALPAWVAWTLWKTFFNEKTEVEKKALQRKRYSSVFIRMQLVPAEHRRVSVSQRRSRILLTATTTPPPSTAGGDLRPTGDN